MKEYIEIKAPAKNNIGLKVVSKREDGYHNLYTFFYPIYGLSDILSFKKNNADYFISNNPLIKDDESNLIIKAKRLIESRISKNLKTGITLQKNIPMGAGLGGGSSDAAATLISLNELYSLHISYDELIQMALELGSDVPFFLKAKPSIGQSRGELLEQIDVDIDCFILIVNPNIHISTAEAFGHVQPADSNWDYKKIIEAEKFNFSRLQKDTSNDFEDFVFAKHPEIKAIKEIMIDNGSLFSMMSGSGSTVYGFFNSRENALNVSNKLKHSFLRRIYNLSDY
ncbi:MAG: 4-(cytidine 5'-diphospho)-2-C-methyl-D-erythritol kinase [Ignavibacteriaceae bacterium]|jgi:4-diphosphocytidyl-2-C-methyl-D-erythritol kinase|nr:4-(cytidine 5'-diphospho)-2-C-methyl-D-erythritol kinase [Ignavibacteriaceae bacterium]